MHSRKTVWQGSKQCSPPGMQQRHESSPTLLEEHEFSHVVQHHLLNRILKPWCPMHTDTRSVDLRLQVAACRRAGRVHQGAGKVCSATTPSQCNCNWYLTRLLLYSSGNSTNVIHAVLGCAWMILALPALLFLQTLLHTLPLLSEATWKLV